MKNNLKNDRENILSRLRKTSKVQTGYPQVSASLERKKITQNMKVMKLKSMMESSRTEVHL